MPKRHPSVAEKIIRNTLFNVFGRSWAILLGILLTPFAMWKLGIANYGIWSFILTITATLTLLDFGLGTSVVKYIAHNQAIQDSLALNRVINSGFFVNGTLALVLSVGVILFHPSIFAAFRVPDERWPEVRFVFSLLLAAFLFDTVLRVFQGILTGFQNMHLTNMITVGLSVLNGVATVVILQLGYGLSGLAINEALTSALGALFTLLICKQVFPALRISPGFLHKETLAHLLTFGFKVQLTSLGAVVSLQLNKLLAGYFLGLNVLAMYELGFKLVYGLIALIRLLTSSVMPATAELQARNDRSLLDQLYIRGSKYVILVIAPLTFLVILNARSIMVSWMGVPFEIAQAVMQVLMVAYGVNLLTSVGTTMARGMGKPEYETSYALLVVGLNLTLSVVLVQYANLAGLLAAILISTVLGSIFFLVLWHRFLGQPWLPFLHQVYLSPLVAGLIATSIAYLGTYMVNVPATPERLANIFMLIASSSLFALVYMLTIKSLRYLDEQDVRLWRQAIRMRLWLTVRLEQSTTENA